VGIEEELLKASQEIDNNRLFLSVHWDGTNKNTDVMLQELVGSGVPFPKSQVL